MRALLLDLYDTILWTDWPAVSGHLVGRLGVDPETLFRGFAASSPARTVGRYDSPAGDMAALVTACGLERDQAFVAELAAEMIGVLGARVRLYPEVVPTLRRLRGRGVRTAVVSNCDRLTRPILDGLGLAREVDALVLSCEVASAKPSPAIFRHALELLGEEDPSRAVFVDDQPRFLDGAAALGMRTFHIVRTPGPGVAQSKHEQLADLSPLEREHG